MSAPQIANYLPASFKPEGADYQLALAEGLRGGGGTPAPAPEQPPLAVTPQLGAGLPPWLREIEAAPMEPRAPRGPTTQGGQYAPGPFEQASAERWQAHQQQQAAAAEAARIAALNAQLSGPDELRQYLPLIEKMGFGRAYF